MAVTAGMTDELRFFVPARFPSLNELIGAANHNRYDGGRMKKKYTDIAESCARRAAMEMGWKAPKGPVAISITWVERDRRRDQDNVTAGQKYLLDGIVAAGVLRKDSQKYIPQPSINQITHDKDAPGVWVVIRRQ